MIHIGYMAVVISTVLVVLFAEIIPQAVCSKHGLALGSIFYIPIKILIGFWFLIAWPISKALGSVIGTNKGTIYTPQGKSKVNDEKGTIVMITNLEVRFI
jgi:CBS domain containing-hemolysin-like protein